MSRCTAHDPRDAADKLNFLQKHSVPRRVLGHAPTLVDFANHLKIPRTTLRDQKLKGRLSSHVQTAIAGALKFRLDWDEWVSGTAATFQERYVRECSVASPAPVRRTDVRLARGSWIEPRPSQTVGLAIVELNGGQYGQGTVAVEVTVSCGMPKVLGVHTTVQSAQMELKCSPARLTRDSFSNWAAAEKTVQGSRGTVRLSFEWGTRAAPSWRLTADGVSIATISLDPDFAALEELAPGDEIKLLFGTWLADLQEVDGAVGDANGRTADGIALLQKDGTELDVARPELSRCIRKGLLPADNNGYVVLASHSLQVVEAAS
jgi:hypothetical protein